ncbi:MAG: TraB/GumN family protein [Bacteroidaceae bacterium]|nr:TraB/GumN family protein [Bacteroidaceae bacterium]
MKAITLTLFALIACINNVFSQAESSAVNSILWEISGKGLTQKSYLLGTFHGPDDTKIDYQYLDTLPKYKEIFAKVDAVAVECNTTDESMVEAYKKHRAMYFSPNNPTYALLPDSIENFSNLFENTEEFHYVDSFMQESLKQRKIFPFDYKKLKPMFTSTIISKYKTIIKVHEKVMKKELLKDMDSELSAKAIEAGKRPFYMETVADQLALDERIDSVACESIGLKDQAKALYLSFLTGDSISNQYSAKFEEFYLKGDLDAAIKNREELLHDSEYPTSEQFMEVANEELVNDRNRRWIPVIDKNVHQSSCLIAVGALHLPGENGLINMLRKEGYTLTPVDIHSR